MRSVQASQAKAQFLRLLDDVERGESVVITRHGKDIAVLAPPSQSQADRARQAFRNIQELRKRTLPVSLDEILSARAEGRP